MPRVHFEHPNQAIFPADAGAKQERFAVRLKFQNVAILHLDGLGNQHHRLVQERREIPEVTRANCPSRGDDRLLVGAVEQNQFRAFALVGLPFEFLGHAVERPGQVAQLGTIVDQAGAAFASRRRPARPAPMAAERALTWRSTNQFPADPRRRQGQKADHEGELGKQISEKRWIFQGRHDGQEGYPHQTNPKTRKAVQ